MENGTNLPFKVGDLAEARSFEEGFRGAWFRCKIRDITTRDGRVVCLEYYDFPEEDLEWMSVFQVPPYPAGDEKEEHSELMLRPHYPPICNKKQMPHVNEISEVTVVVNNSWKVGDLVDMFSHDCYWSGRIKQLLGDDKAKIELNPPSLGEGSDYDGFLKDVRPSLDWSPEHGWTVPILEGGRPCARLIKPVKQVGRNQNGPITDSVMRSTGSSSRLSCCPGPSNSAVSGEVSTRTTEMPIKQPPVSLEYRGSEGFPLKLDTIEESIIVLEQYLNKVKWLKKILASGISSSDVETPKWEFVVPERVPWITSNTFVYQFYGVTINN